MRKLKFSRNKDLAKSLPSLAEPSLPLSASFPGTSGIFPNGLDSRNYDSSDNISSTGMNEEELSSSMEGSLWLSVLLPSGKSVNMEIDANTAMMDLLVLVTTGNGISPGGLVLKVPSDRPPGYISYKPNTPVGKLGCDKIEVVPKSDIFEKPRKQREKMANQPFETIRIQVDLSRGQKTFTRVNPRLSLGEAFGKICAENGDLDPAEFRIRASGAPGLPLDLAQPLGDIGTLHFVIIPAKEENRKSTGDLFGLYAKMPVEEKEKYKAKGFLGIFGKKKKDSPAKWQNKSYSKSGSQRLDGYEPAPQSLSAPPDAQVANGAARIHLNDGMSPDLSVPMREKSSGANGTTGARPMSMPASRILSGSEISPHRTTTNKPPAPRKKRQAPPPPKSSDERGDLRALSGKETRTVHSRQSSDSSGYHETSHSPMGNKPESRPQRAERSCASSDVSSDPGAQSEKSERFSDERTTSPSDWQDSLEREGRGKKQRAPPPPVMPDTISPEVPEENEAMSENMKEALPLTTVIGKDGKDAEASVPPLHGTTQTTDSQDSTTTHPIPSVEEETRQPETRSFPATEPNLLSEDEEEALDLEGDFRELLQAAELKLGGGDSLDPVQKESTPDFGKFSNFEEGGAIEYSMHMQYTPKKFDFFTPLHS